MRRWSRQAVLPLLLLPLFLLSLLSLGCKQNPAPSAGGDGYLFCFWNVENFFDDRDDGRTGPGDKDYDPWFAKNPDILKQKLDKLTEALLQMNDGKGPDILALAEVESPRAAELLQHALNDKLKDEKLHYQNVLMKELKNAGRHIAPAIITRLPVVRDRTRLHGNRLRILEGRVVVNDHELVILASHWTSRIQASSDKARAKYADALYGAARAMHTSNHDVDVLICGDFNDTPADASVKDHLHATADLAAVSKNADPLALYNLMGDKDAARGFGTHY